MKELPVLGLTVECDRCVQKEQCGGLNDLDRYEGCFSACRQRGCRGGKGWTCPCRQTEFIHRMRSVGGMGTFLPPTLLPVRGELPQFIPVIDHAYDRTKPLDYPVAMLPLRFVLPYLRAGFDAADLRKGFGLAENTRLILLGVARDAALERYWRNRVFLGWPERIAQLGFEAATSPNYSFFQDAPRTDIIFNRRRILITSGELSAVGVPTILHLNALTDHDWKYWANLLRQQTEIVYVAKEFQTGLHRTEEGRNALRELVRLQDRIGREIRPVIIGGTQYLEMFARYFASPTFVESSPFMRMVYRRSAELMDHKVRWRTALTAEDEPLDDLLVRNIALTERSIRERWENTRNNTASLITPKKSPVRASQFGVSSDQMKLSFEPVQDA